MEQQEFESMIEMMHSLIKLRKKLSECSECDDNSEECDEDDDDVCPINQALAQEYDALMTWAFGKWQNLGKSESRKIWKKLHPSHPVPRVLVERHAIPSIFANTALIMDILPIYLKEKESDED